jgi:haloacid dehalogenase superfamily, subfamily IA, variant 1 with third motif having Dx(3-4)D or Dx(3-4)E
MKFKAVIFDLDGTLLDTLDDLGDSTNAVLMRRGFPVHEMKEYKHFIGNGIYNLVVRALPEDVKDREFIDNCVQEMREEYSKRIIARTHPYDGITDLFDRLKELNIKMGILSNKPNEATNYVVSKLLPSYEFAEVYGERQGVPRKPDPTGAIDMARSMGVLPSEVLYLGDSGVDMETANKAGMWAVGALWGFRDRDELVENGARAVISKPVELLKYL